MRWKLEGAPAGRDRAGEEQLGFEPGPVGLQRRARRITQPQAERVQIVGRTSLQPCLDGIPELVHAAEHGPIGGPAELHLAQRIHLRGSERCGDRDLLDPGAGGSGEPLAELNLWRERYDDAQERPGIRAQDKVSGARRNNGRIPIAELAGRCTIARVRPQAPQELTGTSERGHTTPADKAGTALQNTILVVI